MLTGGCLCGAIRYQIDGRISFIWFCHCSKCRRVSGSAFQSAAVCKSKRFRWVCGEESIREYRTESGYPARFCPTCGSTVPQAPAGTEYTWIPVGTLDGDPGSRPAHHIWVGSKAPWYEITDDLPQGLGELAPQVDGTGSAPRDT